eukprot:m.11939 g.11939  ORF g.11939 m.11939 type:complete len:2352 (+) comp23692_c0_seq4:198-7253(+)
MYLLPLFALLMLQGIRGSTGAAAIRLVGGSSNWEGRVEIYYSGRWGTVCDDYWGISDANVVCRQLFSSTALSYKIRAYFGLGSGTIWLDDVSCSGSEASLDQCSNRGGWGSHNCGHYEDAGVVCNPRTNLRLVGGSSSYDGRVEIYHSGRWGTVCDDSWSTDDANVVCRELGYGPATAAVCCAGFGQGSGTIWLDNVGCTGTENSLQACSASPWGTHNCGHYEDAGVRCSAPSIPCASLPTPLHCSTSGNSTATGATVTFSCNSGYTLSGSSSRTCQSDGSWSGNQTTCGIVDCGSLNAPRYGSFSGSSTTYGSRITFSCNSGYSLSGSSARSCQSSGRWSGTQPTCNRVYCPYLSRPSYGTISTSSRTVGTTVTFSCSSGYRLIGSSSRICQQSGSWTGSATSCSRITCGSLSAPQNGAKTGTATTYGSVVKFTCKSGYTLSGSSSRSCLSSGTWSGTQPICTPVRCPALPALSHGKMSTTSLNAGTTVTFICSKGYTITGSQSRTCQSSASWTGTQPTCTIVNCGSLTAPSKGTKTGSSTTFGAVISFSCSQGYVLTGSPARTCLSTGSWSGSQPTCTLVDCGTLAAPALGSKTGTITTYGGTISFQCLSGYVRSGSSSRTCQSDGTWSGTQPSCLIVDCGSLSGPLNGEVHGSLATYGSTLVFTCNTGFSRQGSKSRTCQTNGAWSGQAVTCNRVYCPSLVSITNGFMTGSNTSYGASVTFNCKTGFKLFGSNTRTCQTDGTWSGSQPDCSLQHCSPLTNPQEGKVVGGSSAYGMTMNYVCNTGYNLTSGSRTRTCLSKSDGTVYWTGNAAICTIVNCGKLSVPANGQATIASTVYLSPAVFQCNIGYNLLGSPSRTCQANGKWSGQPTSCKIVDCGPLATPAFGSVSGLTTHSATAIFTCRKGFNLLGSSKRTCQANETWTGKETSCKIVDCGPLTAPNDGIATVPNTTYGSVATFKCNIGHSLIGPTSRQCQANEKWSSISTVCNALYCTDPGIPVYGSRIPTSPNFIYGSFLTFSCLQNRVLVGQQKSQCVETNQNPVQVGWTNSLPTCDVIPRLQLNLSFADKTKNINGIDLAYAAGWSRSQSGNRSLTFSCFPVMGDPVPKVSWHYGSTAINVTKGSSSTVYQTYNTQTGQSDLTFNEFTNVNERAYSCKATNRAGRDEKSFTLVQQLNPEQVNKPTLTVLSAWAVEVSWISPTFDGYSPLTQYDIQLTSFIRGQWESKTVAVSSVTNVKLFTGLRPFTTYNARVRAANKIGDGPYSSAVSSRTLQAAPSAPYFFGGQPISSDSIALSWTTPLETNGIIQGYAITYTDESFGKAVQFSAAFNASTYNTTVKGLLPNRFYRFMIRAKTEEPIGNVLWGNLSGFIDIKTLPSEPFSAPTTSGYSLGSNAIYISWMSPPPEDLNGNLTGFRITYSSQGIQKNTSVDMTVRQYNLSLLRPHTKYEIQVFAVNIVGASPGSIPIAIKTGEDPPLTPPLNITALALSPNNLTIQWSPLLSSDIPGVLIGYNVFYKAENHQENHIVLDANQTTILLTDLVPFTNYSVSVAARTGGGIGPRGTSDPPKVLTHEDVPSSPEGLIVTLLSATEVTINWNEPLVLNGRLLNYTLFYWNSTYEGNVSTSERRLTLTNLNEFTDYSFSATSSTKAGAGPRCQTVVVKTFESEPSDAPVLMSANSATPTTINITWAPPPPQSINGLLIFYEIQYNKTEFGMFSDVFNVSAKEEQWTLQNLEEFVLYWIKIRAYTSVGPGPFVMANVRTIASPSSPPLSVYVNSTSSTSVFVEWAPPLEKDLNGIFAGFQVQYATNSSDQVVPFMINTTSFHLTDLEKWTHYKMQVRVVTMTKFGATLISSWTAGPTTRTDEDTPDAPTDFTAQITEATKSILTWNSPEKPNGVLLAFYLVIEEVSYITAEESSVVSDPMNPLKGKIFSIDPDQDLIQLTGLHPFTQYKLTLKGETAVGTGRTTAMTMKTQQSAPLETVQNFASVSRTMNDGVVSVTLKWTPPLLADRNGIVKSYQLEYSPQGPGRQTASSPAPGYLEFADILNNEGQDKSRNQLISGLDGNRVYSFSVSACTYQQGNRMCGPSSAVTLTTAETAPTGAPTINDVVFVSESAAVLYWKSLAQQERQGNLTQYLLKLSYSDEDRPDTLQHEEQYKILANRTEYAVFGLKTRTRYAATIAAATARGEGPESQPFVFTAELQPCSSKLFCTKGNCYLTAMKNETCFCESSTQNFDSCVYDKIIIEAKEQSQGSQIDPLIIYVAVGTGVGLIILVLVIILCVCWCRRKEGGFQPSYEKDVLDFQENPTTSIGSTPFGGFGRPTSMMETFEVANPVYDTLDESMKNDSDATAM